MRLYIGNTELPLESNVIAQTKQINDLFSLDTRQANFTNTIKVPKTPQAIEALGLLGIPGNTSDRPYIKNDAALYADNGLCYVYKGWAIINSTDDYYNITIYDGNIDIYKAIDGFKLSDIPMPELQHDKTPANVAGSINNSRKYRYMFANYGGKIETYMGHTNIDYLTPWANVKYIWDCIFEYFGFTYDCAIFNTSKWTDLWLSYPKGTYKTDPIIDEIEGPTNVIPLISKTSRFLEFTAGDIQVNTPLFMAPNRFTINQTGEYEIEIMGDVANASILGGIVQIYVSKGNNAQNPGTAVNFKTIHVSSINGQQTLQINTSVKVHLNVGEIISFVIVASGGAMITTGLNLVVRRRNASGINFQESLIDWSVRDFFNEILWKFGLTPYKDKFRNHYNFYSLDELMRKSKAIDISDKFVSQEKEIYLYSKYCQNNLFKYKYDNEGVDYYDGNIQVLNKNLENETTLIQSKTFAPTRLENGEDMWKAYDKEVNDNGEVSYKNLTGRFYFATTRTEKRKGVRLLSDLVSMPMATIQKVYLPNFEFQKYDYIVGNYYGMINNILNNAKVVTANINFNEVDIINLDFTKPVYIKQLGSYFLINKVMNYQEGEGATKTELIQIDLLENVFKGPILTLDTGGTTFNCLQSDLLQVVFDNTKGDVIFEGIPGEASVTKIMDGVYEFTNVVASSTLTATVTDIDGISRVTNPIKIIKNE